MLLAMNLGNSSLACGVFDRERLVTRVRIVSSVERSADEYEALLGSILESKGVAPADIKASALASVVPDLNEVLGGAVEQLLGAPPFMISPAVDSGLSFNTDNYMELGSDLLANAAAAVELYRTSCIVVDFGTALSFTVVDAARCVHGAAIAPGLRGAVHSLVSDTAQLPHVELQPPPRAIGTNTIHAIQSGIVFGYAGLVEAMVNRMQRELPERATVVVTGGMSPRIVDEISVVDDRAPDLTLHGVRLIAERNRVV